MNSRFFIQFCGCLRPFSQMKRLRLVKPLCFIWTLEICLGCNKKGTFFSSFYILEILLLSQIEPFGLFLSQMHIVIVRIEFSPLGTNDVSNGH